MSFRLLDMFAKDSYTRQSLQNNQDRLQALFSLHVVRPIIAISNIFAVYPGALISGFDRRFYRPKACRILV